MAMEGLVARLASVAQDLQEATTNGPAVVIRPSLNRVHEVRQQLEVAVAEAAAHRTCDPEELVKMEVALDELVGRLKDQVDSKPWNDPAALKELRQTESDVATKSRTFIKLQRRLFPGTEAQDDLPWWDPQAYNNAVRSELDVLQSMLPTNAPEDVPCWGMVHAAGTLGQTKMVDHTPQKFKYVFQPKSEAAWSIHQLRALHP